VVAAAAPSGHRDPMRIIRRYLFWTILGTLGLVLSVVLSLGAFIQFIGQLNDIGVGEYGLGDALLWVLMQLPTVVFELLPIAALLGALLGLGTLASRSELIVLRAAGVSPRGLARAVFVTGIVLAFIGGVLGEYLAPPLQRYARQFRTLEKFGQTGLGSGQTAWIRDGDTILGVSAPDEERPGGDVLLFRIAPDHQLTAIGRANGVRIVPDDQWLLDDYAQTSFGAGRVRAQRSGQPLAIRGLNPDLLGLTIVREESMTGVALWRYVNYLKSNGMNARSYEVAFWGRIAAILAVPLMCVLAVPFVLGPLRTTGTGARMLAGLGIGFAWFLVSRALTDGGAVWNLPPIATAWLPTMLLAAATAFMVTRAR
jgi:lipopolysaccharide export system permease protein